MSLPRGWAQATIADIADTQLGKMLDAAKNKGRSVRYLRNINVRWGEFDLSDLQEMRVAPNELDHFAVRDGDIFVCEGGEPGRAAVWRNGDQDLIFQKALHRLRVLDGMQPDYLAQYVRFAVTQHDFSNLLTGTTIKHLPQVALQRMGVAVPPAAEQRRIVEKLEVLTGRVASAAVELDRVMRLSERIRLSMLTQLFARFSDNSIERLDEVCRIGTGSTPKRGNPRYYNKGTVPWVTSGVVNQRIVNEPTEFITDTALKETNCKVFPAGSLIVALYGEGKTRGKVARLAIAAATNQALAALHSFDERIDPEWIALFLEARYQETREEAAGGVQPNLNLGIIKAIRLPVPALQEQRAAIQKMNNIFARADRLEAEAARARALLYRLETAILTKAFKGELVPQDPNEEPASVLFHRIKVARSQQAQSQPKRGRKASVPKTPREKAVMTKSRQDEDVKNKPYLANIIRQAGGSSEVEDLFKKADLPVTDFYKQLAWEVDQGHIHDQNNQTLRAA